MTAGEARLPGRHRAEPRQDDHQPRAARRHPRPGPATRIPEAGRPALPRRRRHARRRGRRADERGLRAARRAERHVARDAAATLHDRFHHGPHRRRPRGADHRRPSDAWRAGKDLVVIEGTGHAGVGAVIGPVERARRGPARRSGHHRQRGRHRAADRRDRAQPRPLRGARRAGLGAVVNKVDVESHPHLPEVLVRGLAQHGIELLGCIPYSEFLANPSLELIATHLDGELLSGRGEPGRTIGLGRHRRHAGRPTPSSTCAIGRSSSRPGIARTSSAWPST